MFGSHGSVGSPHCGLDVAKDGVDPFELWLLGRFRSAAGFDHGMRASRAGDGGEAGERIGDDIGAGGEHPAREFANSNLAKANNAAKGDLIGFPITGSSASSSANCFSSCRQFEPAEASMSLDRCPSAERRVRVRDKFARSAWRHPAVLKAKIRHSNSTI